MEDKIEVNEYVRFNNGEIGKVIDIKENPSRIVYSEYGEIGLISDIVKHSKQLIDLIEVGDIVNGMEVLDIHKPRDLWEPIEIRVDSRYTNFILVEDIKTILTKEQMEANQYVIK